MSVACIPYEAEGRGVGEVWLDDRCLVWHELPRSSPGTRARARATPTQQGGADRPPPSRSTLPPKHTRVGDGSAPVAEKLIRRLRDYFGGKRVSFDDVHLELEGWTAFQLDIARALRGSLGPDYKQRLLALEGVTL